MPHPESLPASTCVRTSGIIHDLYDIYARMNPEDAASFACLSVISHPDGLHAGMRDLGPDPNRIHGSSMTHACWSAMAARVATWCHGPSVDPLLRSVSALAALRHHGVIHACIDAYHRSDHRMSTLGKDSISKTADRMVSCIGILSRSCHMTDDRHSDILRAWIDSGGSVAHAHPRTWERIAAWDHGPDDHGLILTKAFVQIHGHAVSGNPLSSLLASAAHPIGRIMVPYLLEGIHDHILLATFIQMMDGRDDPVSPGHIQPMS